MPFSPAAEGKRGTVTKVLLDFCDPPVPACREAIMGDSPATRASLLVRIRDARDALAWSQFVELYAPLV